jgi:lysophospholipase L1-like esterase
MTRSPLLATVLAVALAACGVLPGTDGYLEGVGRIPGGDFESIVALPEGVAVDFPELAGDPLGRTAEGTRLLMIGDSILASTSSRYGDEMCGTLTQLGWEVALEAEAGSFVNFGQKVLRDRFDEGWDAVVVFLGTNYDGNVSNYETRLRDVVETVWPLPVLLLTTGTFRDAQREVNEIIWAVRDSYDHVTVLDWSRILETGGLLSDDGVHLNRNGRRVIASAIARAVQFAPTDQPGACLDSRFRNDSKVADAMPTDDEVVADEPVETTVAPDVPATETTVP